MKTSRQTWIALILAVAIGASGCQPAPVSVPAPVTLTPPIVLTTQLSKPQQPINIQGVNGFKPDADWENLSSQLKTNQYEVVTSSTSANSYGVIIQRDAIYITAEIEADSSVKSISYQLRIASPPQTIPGKHWESVSVETLLRSYGAPTQIRSKLFQTGDGMIGSLLLIWEDSNTAISYAVELTESANSAATYSYCILPTTASDIHLWLRQGNVLDLVHEEGFGLYDRLLEPGMFTNAATLEQVRDVLLRGECLESPLSFWGYG